MGLWQKLRNLFEPDTGRFDVTELARRLDVPEDTLRTVQPAYRLFSIPKRGGGQRVISAPEPQLKALQRRILRRLLGRLRCHTNVTGFERGHSIVTNARCHAGQAVVARMDLRDFFPSTRAKRVERYFRTIGWNREAAALLTRICTHGDGLPQGAPTSPRLANLVNYHMDARLAGVATRYGAAYTRYADDLTFSLPRDEPAAIHALIRIVKLAVADCGYALHQRRKLRICRRHQRQTVTGLVVNDRVNLPRRVRRRLRAIEHHLRTGRDATLNEVQIAGWHALRSMITQQANS
jgi:retron-type reverse transcriptase